jgi:monoamine oxidase
VRGDALARIPLPLDLTAGERGLSQGALLQRYVGTLPPDLADPAPAGATYANWEAYDRVTWPDWLRSRGASEGAIRLMTLGGDSRDLSALYVLRQYALLRGGNQFFKIEGGMDRLPRAMAAALGPIVQYNRAVTGIDQTAPVTVVDYLEQGEQRRAAASHVILTVPLPLLSGIEFYPDLSPEKRRLVADLPYFQATRFLLQSYTRFWQASGLSGYVRSDQPIEIWDATYELPGRAGILGATVGGAIGRRLLTMSDESAVPYGRELVAVSLPQIRTSFETGVAHQWALEPYAKGAFAVFHPGQMTAMMPGIAKPEGRLHFAGEHTSSWMGWMEGALESGERAAREVLG